jgi:hypothetical protein
MRRTPIRSAIWLLAVLAVAASACSGSGDSSSPEPSPHSIDSLRQGAVELSLISTTSPVNPGKNAFSFGLITNQGAVVTGGTPQVWVAQDTTSAALGPTPATWYPFAPASEFDDTAPRTPLPGTFSTTIDVPSVGSWIVGVTASQGSSKFFGTATLPVTDEAIPAALGTKAVSVKTPVATTERQARMIDTRDPPSPLHYISLDKALENGKPTVVAFATPALCESMLCGPVVDEVLLVYEKVGKAKANFIHVEEFLPGEDFTPPPATAENQSPAFKAYGFTTEPWTLVIDRKGIIRARFEGPVTAAMVEAALNPLL